MKKIILILLILLLSGCGTLLTNDEIIAACKKCEDAGFGALAFRNEGSRIVEIQCWNKPEEK